jgi:hypothetical protein
VEWLIRWSTGWPDVAKICLALAFLPLAAFVGLLLKGFSGEEDEG